MTGVQLKLVEHIVNSHIALVDLTATKESADPYPIALAKDTQGTVVTEENYLYKQPNTKLKYPTFVRVKMFGV